MTTTAQPTPPPIQRTTTHVRFEAAHRVLSGHLTGHSWEAWITYEIRRGTAQGDTGPTVTGDAAGHLSSTVARWVAEHFDNACLLAEDDQLVAVLGQFHLRTYVFGRDPYTKGLGPPTCEAVAEVIRRRAAAVSVPACRVVSVRVRESADREAEAVSPAPTPADPEESARGWVGSLGGHGSGRDDG